MTMTETIEWVPTAERMPDVDAFVLVQTSDLVSGVLLAEYIGGSNFGAFDPLDGAWVLLSPVTHWAELPKGPR